jgi:DDE superfamily endonuclease
LDESDFAHDMPRIHGYSAKGSLCFGTQNWNAKGRTNAIGAIIGKLILTVMLFTTNIDADVFHGWVKQDLLLKCSPNSVIVMDNAAFYKRKDIQDAITKAGHTLEYLPPYSPDLNPIEPKSLAHGLDPWGAQAKAIRKKYQCSIEEIFKNKLNHFN